MKTSTLDNTFSLLVRERNNWACEKCSCFFPEDERVRLHCSHIITRTYRNLRWHPLNDVAHCAECHRYLTDRPTEFGRWVENYPRLGPLAADRLREMAIPIGKMSAPLMKEIHSNLKTSLEAMRMQRADGVTGRIEFESPYP